MSTFRVQLVPHCWEVWVGGRCEWNLSEFASTCLAQSHRPRTVFWSNDSSVTSRDLAAVAVPFIDHYATEKLRTNVREALAPMSGARSLHLCDGQIATQGTQALRPQRLPSIVSRHRDYIFHR